MALKSFVEVHPESHFPIQNLPYGVFRPQPGSSARPGVAIGDYALDLSEIALAGLFDGPILKDSDCFIQPNLNKFLAMGRPAWVEARATLQKLLSSTEPTLRDNASLRQKSLVPLSNVEMVLPVVIGDYTDFFSSIHHTKNCGIIFRGPQTPIRENWYQLPVAYHGRASSIVISGTDIVRPRGQSAPTCSSMPQFGPSQKIDFELEMLETFKRGNLFLLGLFLGKILVRIKPAGQEDSAVLSRSNLKHLYWTLTQQLAHHTVNGCNLRPGDLLGTGTISGPEPDSFGCLLELTWNGQKPLSLNGTQRKFLEDGDEVIFSGFSKNYNYSHFCSSLSVGLFGGCYKEWFAHGRWICCWLWDMLGKNSSITAMLKLLFSADWHQSMAPLIPLFLFHYELFSVYTLMELGTGK